MDTTMPAAMSAGGDRDPRLALDWAEVTGMCALLDHAATLLTHDQADQRGQDGVCCHQQHQTGHWKDSQLVGGWLSDLTASLRARSNTALYDAQHPDHTDTDTDTEGERF